jgi:hypothetical protein
MAHRAGTLARLAEAARELQWTAVSARVGAVTVSDQGGDLDRQLQVCVACVQRSSRARAHLAHSAARAESDVAHECARHLRAGESARRPRA